MKTAEARALCEIGCLSYELKSLYVTPDIAAQWLKDQPDWKLRPLRRASVARYKSDMLKDRWDSSTSLAVHIDDTGKVFLANGQHRLSALMRSGKTVLMSVMYFYDLASAKRFREICDFNTPISSSDLTVALTDVSDPVARTACVNVVLAAYYGGTITKLQRPDVVQMNRHIKHMYADFDIVRCSYGMRNKTISAALMLGVGMMERKSIDLAVFEQMQSNTISDKSWGILNRYIEGSRETLLRVRFANVLNGIIQIVRTGKLRKIAGSVDSKTVVADAVSLGARFLLPKKQLATV
jgi:hypothetical protein